MEKGKTDIVAQICAKHKVKVVYRNPKGEYFTEMNLALLSVDGDRKKIETCTPGSAKKSEGTKVAETEKPVETKKGAEKGKAVKVTVKTSEAKETKPEEESEAVAEDEQPKKEGEDE